MPIGISLAIARAIVPSIALLAAIAAPRPATGELRRFMAVPDKSEVMFTASFPLGKFTGRTSQIAGEFRADPADLPHAAAGSLRIAVTGLRTGNSGRDRDMYRALAADRYPEIRFTLERIEASFPSVTDKTDVLLTIHGTLAIRGIERPIALPGRVRLRDDRLWVRGESELRMTEFGVRPPRRFFLAVDDRVLVEFDITLAAKP